MPTKHPSRPGRPGKPRAIREPIPKDIWKPVPILSPVPIVMVSCAGKETRPNIITIAWAGTVCSDPPMLSISVRKERHSYGLIMETKEFVVNVPGEKEIRATDWCGVKSGRDVDKFAETGLTAAPSTKVKVPIIEECPLNIECKVRRVLDLGSHTMFIAEIVAVQVTKELIMKNGRLALEKANLGLFAHGNYYTVGKHIGRFGYSVRKKK